MRFSNRVRSNPVLFKFVKLGLVEDLSVVDAGSVLHSTLSEICVYISRLAKTNLQDVFWRFQNQNMCKRVLPDRGLKMLDIM